MIQNNIIICLVCALITITIFTPIGHSSETVGVDRKIEYWDGGNIRSCSVLYPGGNIKVKASCRPDGTIEKIEKFDKRGNRVQEALYDHKGRLRVGIDGWAAMRWWYEESHIVSQISYGEDGRAIERKRYSESGRLVSRQYNDDGNIDPNEEANMATLLGGQNIAYYKPETRDEGDPITGKG